MPLEQCWRSISSGLTSGTHSVTLWNRPSMCSSPDEVSKSCNIEKLQLSPHTTFVILSGILVSSMSTIVLDEQKKRSDTLSAIDPGRLFWKDGRFANLLLRKIGVTRTVVGLAVDEAPAKRGVFSLRHRIWKAVIGICVEAQHITRAAKNSKITTSLIWCIVVISVFIVQRSRTVIYVKASHYLYSIGRDKNRTHLEIYFFAFMLTRINGLV